MQVRRIETGSKIYTQYFTKDEHVPKESQEFRNLLILEIKSNFKIGGFGTPRSYLRVYSTTEVQLR